jgi:hypothetical protein
MKQDDDFIGQLEDYLESFEGTTPLPDRVRDAVHAELPWTHQVNPLLGLRRTEMTSTTTLFRWGLLAAALVVVAFAATALLPGGANPAVTPTSAPPASAPPTATPVATPIVALSAAGQGPCGTASPSDAFCIPRGNYRLDPDLPGGRIDVPAGWVPWSPGAGSIGLLVDRPDAAQGTGWGVMFMEVGDVARDPCRWAAGTLPAAQVDTPEKLSAAMRSWPGFIATPPQAITIAGMAGVRIRLTWSKDPSACPTPIVWRTPAGTAIDGYPMVDGGSTLRGAAYPADFSLIKVDGHILAIRTTASASTSPFERGQGVADDPKRHEADLVTLQNIIDSVQFDGSAQ